MERDESSPRETEPPRNEPSFSRRPWWKLARRPRWKLALAVGGVLGVAVLAALLLGGVFSSSGNANTRAAQRASDLANSAAGLTKQLTGIAGQLRQNPTPAQRQRLLKELAANKRAVNKLRAQANQELEGNPRVAAPIRQAIQIVVVVSNDVDGAGSDLTYVVVHPDSPTSSNRLIDATSRAQDVQMHAQQLAALLGPFLPSTTATTNPTLAATCSNEIIGPVSVRFVLRGNVSCNEAHQTWGSLRTAGTTKLSNPYLYSGRVRGRLDLRFDERRRGEAIWRPRRGMSAQRRQLQGVRGQSYVRRSFRRSFRRSLHEEGAHRRIAAGS